MTLTIINKKISQLFHSLIYLFFTLRGCYPSSEKDEVGAGNPDGEGMMGAHIMFQFHPTGKDQILATKKEEEEEASDIPWEDTSSSLVGHHRERLLR